jgi:predicted TPR repeat methyltransferase
LIGLFPKAIVLYNLQGASNAALQRLDAAIDSYKQALKIQPNHAEVYYNMGIALKNKGDLDAAIDSYKQALKIKPDYAEAYSNMGNVLKDKGDLNAAIDSYKKAIKLKPDYADAYNNMGISLKDKGDLDAAIESYKKALKIKPDLAEAYYNMGTSLKDKGDLDAAIVSYKQALEIKPDHGEAKHLLASLNGETTASAPRDYVKKLFDDYASRFEHSLVDKLGYQIPRIISEMVLKNHSSGSLGSVLDLGCGTGLAGVELKQFCCNLEGLDLSNSMLAQAKEKNIYNKLVHGDILEYLSEADLDFDYFISTDVFVYVGELSDVFRLIKSRNRRGGKLVFSTEHIEKNGFYLEKSGRYSHSKQYIGRLCDEYDYQLSYFRTADLRKDKDNFVTGGLYLLDF